MAKPERLAWGKSPFDDMEHDELLLWARRMYHACTETRSVMALTRGLQSSSTFWGPGGTGGDAMTKVEFVVEEIEKRFDRESIYRSFYRYAVDLLFSPKLGFAWAICTVEGCGQMLGRYDPAMPPPTCPSHRETPMRPITWDDLSPRHAK